MMRGAFGGPRQIEETLLKTAPLLLMGLGLTAAFRARVWNIGGEGQHGRRQAAPPLSRWPVRGATIVVPPANVTVAHYGLHPGLKDPSRH
jgi:hypothetical protein